MIFSWTIQEIQKALVINFMGHFSSAFYLDSFRYSMQIRLNGKRSKFDKKLTHFPAFQTFLHKRVCPSICPSIYLSIHPSIWPMNCPLVRPSIHLSVSVHPSVRPSATHSSNSFLGQKFVLGRPPP